MIGPCSFVVYTVGTLLSTTLFTAHDGKQTKIEKKLEIEGTAVVQFLEKEILESIEGKIEDEAQDVQCGCFESNESKKEETKVENLAEDKEAQAKVEPEIESEKEEVIVQCHGI